MHGIEENVSGRGSKHRRTRTGARDAITAMQRGANVQKRGRRGRSKQYVLRLSADEQNLLYYSRKHAATRRVSVHRIVSVVMGGDTSWQKRLRGRSCTLTLRDDLEGREALRLVFRDEGECALWGLGLAALAQKHNQTEQKECVGDQETSPARLLGDLVAFGGDGLGHVRAVGGLRGVDARHVACGEGTALLADARGRAHALERTAGTRPRRAALGGAAVSAAYCSYHNAAAIDTRGALHMWRHTRGMLEGWMPVRMVFPPLVRVWKVSLGAHHAAAITHDGMLFTWGDGSFGALGHGEKEFQQFPRPVERLQGMKARAVSCGAWHTAVIVNGTSTEAKVEAGKQKKPSDVSGMEGGDFRTLRRRFQQAFLMQSRISKHTRSSPREQQSSTDGEESRSLAQSTQGCVDKAIAKCSLLYTFGDGSFGQLGHGDKEQVRIPKLVEALEGHTVAHVSCGERHTCVAVSGPVRRVFTWGDGGKGCLGQGPKVCGKILAPREVNRLRGLRVLQLASGPHHNALIAIPAGKQWGSGGKGVSGDSVESIPQEIQGVSDQNGKGMETKCDALRNNAAQMPRLQRRVTPGNSTPRLPPPVEAGTVDTEINRDPASEPGGLLWMWGHGKDGCLGLGNSTNVYIPTPALQGRRVLQVSCGSNFTAAVVVHRLDDDLARNRCRCCARPFTVQRKVKICQSCGAQCCKDCLGDVFLDFQAKLPRRNSMLGGPQVCKSCAHRLQMAEEEAALRTKQEANRSGERKTMSHSRALIGPGESYNHAEAVGSEWHDTSEHPSRLFTVNSVDSLASMATVQTQLTDRSTRSEVEGQMTGRSNPPRNEERDDNDTLRSVGDSLHENAYAAWYDAEDRFVRWKED